MDKKLSFSDSWTLKVPDSYKNFNRTITSASGAGTSNQYTLNFDFSGTGFNIVGASSKASLDVSIDGKDIGTFNTPVSDARQVTFAKSGLENKAHTVSINVVSGSYTVDAVEILSGNKHEKNSAAKEINIGDSDNN